MPGTNALIEQALGIPVQKSPVYTAKYLLMDCYKGKEKVIRDATFDLRDLPFYDAARDVIKRLDLAPWMIGKTVHHFDKASAYLSACSSTNTGIGDPIHVAHGDDDTHIVPGLPGIYRVSVRKQPQEVYPIVKDGQQWITCDVLIYAQQKGYEFHIHEAWVWEDYERILGNRHDKRNWAKRIWDARQALKGTEAYDDMKVIAIVGVGSFATRKDKYAGTRLIHPNWWADVVGKARVNMLANIEKYAKEAGYPVLVKTDGLFYVSRDANPRTAVPGILDRMDKLGGYRHKFSLTLTRELYEQAEGVGPGELGKLFKAAAGMPEEGNYEE